MDATVLQTWVPIVLGLVNLGGIVWVWLTSQSKSNALEIKALVESLAAVERRTSSLEQSMMHLPSKEMVHQLQLSVESMSGDLRVLGESLKGVRETSGLVRDYLLKQKGAV